MTPKTLLLPALLLMAPALAWSAPAISHDAALYGSPAPAEAVTRTIDIAPGTHFVRVDSGESVAIRAGGQTVGWTFLQALNGSTMNLGVLMPQVRQARDVYIQIAPSEVYSAG